MGKNLDAAIKQVGSLISEAMQQTLFGYGIPHNSDLANSIKPIVTTEKGKETTLQIQMLAYGQYVEEGRRRGAKMPPVQAIKDWILQRGIRKPAKYSTDGFAFAVARSIGKKGIKPRPFIQPSVKNVLENKGYALILEGALADLIEA